MNKISSNAAADRLRKAGYRVKIGHARMQVLIGKKCVGMLNVEKAEVHESPVIRLVNNFAKVKSNG